MLPPESPLVLSLIMARSLSERGVKIASLQRPALLSSGPLVLSYGTSPFLCKLPSPGHVSPVGDVLLLCLVLPAAWIIEKGDFLNTWFLSWTTMEKVFIFGWQLMGHPVYPVKEFSSQAGKLKLRSSGTARDVYRDGVFLSMKLVWAWCSFREHQLVSRER